jgi:hypothetical protein
MVLDDRAGLAPKLNGRFNYNILDEQVRQAVRTTIKPIRTYEWCGSARPDQNILEGYKGVWLRANG